MGKAAACRERDFDFLRWEACAFPLDVIGIRAGPTGVCDTRSEWNSFHKHAMRRRFSFRTEDLSGTHVKTVEAATIQQVVIILKGLLI